MKGTGAKRNVCPGSSVSTGAKFPVAPVQGVGAYGSVGPFDENVSNFVRNPLLQQATALISFVGVVKNVGNTKL